MSKPLKIILCILVATVGLALIIYTIYYNVNVLIDMNSSSKSNNSQSSSTNNVVSENTLNETNEIVQDSSSEENTISINSLWSEMNEVGNVVQ